MDGVAGLGYRPNATLDTIESARNRLHDLIGDVALLPSEDQTHLVAQVGLKARGLLNAELSRAVYKSQEIGSGGPIAPLSARAAPRPGGADVENPWSRAPQLAAWLEDQNTTHTRGRTYYPITQGKTERCHRSMKNLQARSPPSKHTDDQ